MSRQSAVGKRAWRERAGRYPAELRHQIEHEAAVRFAGWQVHGREPWWFRLKRALRRAFSATVERVR